MGARRLPKHLFSLLAALTPAFAQVAPELVSIPGGKCPIGATVSHEEIHKETVAGFKIAKYLVTNEEYKRFVDETNHPPPGSNSLNSKYRLWEGRGFPETITRQPVVNVTWEDATAYCQWLSRKTGGKFRLPTEEEWEIAARGGLEKKPYPWGDGIDRTSAWYGHKWNGVKTMQPVDYGKPNAYGLYSMSGNVWQWTADWFVPTFNGRPVQEELQLYRVIRGGSWANEAEFLTVNYRNFHPPRLCDLFLGFRVAADE
jgi:formylglycine-generating enzyme required for sulfatase activity